MSRHGRHRARRAERPRDPGGEWREPVRPGGGRPPGRGGPVRRRRRGPGRAPGPPGPPGSEGCGPPGDRPRRSRRRPRGRNRTGGRRRRPRWDLGSVAVGGSIREGTPPSGELRVSR
ncbi:hypothetical protein BRD00_14650 [Halobacteriales archaeon QS_8_69_26]|nr:MAG: hypothetical protein BRD00_14650 [Halobacteriales archaeon QS_8_69_26]